MTAYPLLIRRASAEDVAGIVQVLEAIVAERTCQWTIDQEKRYLQSLSSREILHVAIDAARGIVGFQRIDLWSSHLGSMAHVGQVGTFLWPAFRAR